MNSTDIVIIAEDSSNVSLIASVRPQGLVIHESKNIATDRKSTSLFLY